MSNQCQGGEIKPQWGIYITVDDVDATARKAEELGGKVLMPPTDIPKVGRFSTLMDPQGVMFSVITYLPM
jgi:predicted enzyme related to lactoylglutathione lyase